MKRNFILGLLLTASVLFTFSCKYPDIPKTYEIRGKLKLDYAPYLRKTTDLHTNAAIGLQNKYRDVYYIVVAHPWRADSGYVQYLYDSLANDLKNVKNIDGLVKETLVLTDTTYTNEKGYYVQELVMSGGLRDKKLLFDMQLIRKDTFLYQTSGWMFLEKKDLWLKDIQAMNKSLTILDAK